MKLLLLCAALAALLAPLRRLAQASASSMPPDELSALPKPSAEVARALSFGFENVLSDEWWLEAIQYYGDMRHSSEENRGLAPLLDRATDLDPDFGYAYQFAGQSVPYHESRDGLWYNTEAAIQLLKKGVESQSTRWQIPWLLGYSLFTFRGDYAAAGSYLAEAAKRPRAPKYLEFLAGRLLAQGGKVSTAILLTQAALSQAADDKERQQLVDRLKALQLQDQLDQLNAILAERKRAGLKTSSVDELTGSRGPGSQPTDPFGGRFRLDPQGNKVLSPNERKLLRLYTRSGSPAVERHAD